MKDAKFAAGRQSKADELEERLIDFAVRKAFSESAENACRQTHRGPDFAVGNISST